MVNKKVIKNALYFLKQNSYSLSIFLSEAGSASMKKHVQAGEIFYFLVLSML